MTKHVVSVSGDKDSAAWAKARAMASNLPNLRNPEVKHRQKALICRQWLAALKGNVNLTSAAHSAYALAVVGKQPAAGLGSLCDRGDEPQTKRLAAFSLSGVPLWVVRTGEPQGSPVRSRYFPSRSVPPARVGKRGRRFVHRTGYRTMSSIASGATAPVDHDEPTPFDLHDLYRINADCGYTRALTLNVSQVQSLAASLRGISAIACLLVASNDAEAFCLGEYITSGLNDALNQLTNRAELVLERANNKGVSA